MADGGVLTDRASLARAFYRLTGTSSTNPGLIEHDGAATLEALYSFLQYGAWDAQAFLIDNGLADRWITVSSTLSFSGSFLTDAGKYASLPADFIKLAGDEEYSALRQPNGTKWGRLIDFRERHRAYGNNYWLQDEQLWVTRGASPPSNLVMEYHHRLATLADSATVDFPTEHRALIVAYAADRAMTDAWLPGDMEMQAKIASNLIKQQKEARRRLRRSSGPKKLKMRRSGATHHWA